MKFLLFTILAILLFSCDFKKKIKLHSGLVPKYSMNFIPTDKKLSFKINNEIINRSFCLNSFTSKDSIQYLFYLSEYTNQLCIFNIDSQKIENVVNLERRGPNEVGDVNGFEILSFDSIIITSNHRKKFFLVNQKGKLLSSIDYTKYKQEGIVYSPTCRTLENMRMGFKNSKIYFPFYPGYDEGNYKSIAPEKIRFIAELDTATQCSYRLNIGFPNNYWDNKYLPPFFGFFIMKDKFYINYMYDDLILVSSNGKDWQSFDAKSKYINVKNDYLGFANGVSGHYSRLVPNPYRNEFYRFVVHKQKKYKTRTSSDMTRYPPNFSIMILDKDLNVIGETVFPSDIYDSSGYFITKDGLYLSLSNPFNPKYNVDLLEFQLFKIVENEK
jgi:hypothetical protein